MTDPPDIVIIGSINAMLILVGSVAEVGSLALFDVTAPREGVNLGSMLGADVMLSVVVALDCATARGVVARFRIVREIIALRR